MKISLDQQIEEVERELAFRADVYPRQVTSGKMRQSIADYHVARMKAALATLQWLKKHRSAALTGAKPVPAAQEVEL